MERRLLLKGNVKKGFKIYSNLYSFFKFIYYYFFQMFFLFFDGHHQTAALASSELVQKHFPDLGLQTHFWFIFPLNIIYFLSFFTLL